MTVTDVTPSILSFPPKDWYSAWKNMPSCYHADCLKDIFSEYGKIVPRKTTIGDCAIIIVPDVSVSIDQNFGEYVAEGITSFALSDQSMNYFPLQASSTAIHEKMMRELNGRISMVPDYVKILMRRIILSDHSGVDHFTLYKTEKVNGISGRRKRANDPVFVGGLDKILG